MTSSNGTARRAELARLDRCERGLLASATAGEPRAVDTVRAILARRGRLLGLERGPVR